MRSVDEIDNLRLIENNLLHMRFELDRDSPSYIRLAREAHLLLYRTMIEALTCGNWQRVTQFKSKDRPSKCFSIKYLTGGKPCQEIHKMSIEGDKGVWRFSDPVIYPPPPESEIEKVFFKNLFRSMHNAKLIHFYDALAMIQTECFMHQSIFSKPILISNEDMKTLEWLHKSIRDEYEHFIPKFYQVPVYDLLAATELCLIISKFLLFESGNVDFHGVTKKSLKELLELVFKGVVSLRKITANNPQNPPKIQIGRIGWK